MSEVDFIEWYNSYQYASKVVVRLINNLPDDYRLPDRIENLEEWEKVKDGFPDPTP